MSNEYMLFSIITVTFNAQNTIKRTLESAAQQTFRNFQHIIIDGASKDNTLLLAEKYKNENNDIDVKILSEPDKGIYDAMNKGIKMADGKYLCFLNAGDKFHNKDVLKILALTIEKQQSLPTVVYGDTDIVDDNGNFIRHRRLQPPAKLSYKSFKSGMLVCHQSFYALRDIAPLYDIKYRFSADFDWCINVIKVAEKNNLPMVNANAILTDYLQEGMTTKNHKASLKERFNIMAKHYGLGQTIIQHIWFTIRAIIKK